MAEEETINTPEIPEEVVGVPYTLLQSFLGKYYIGRSPGLFLRSGSHCWGGVINPRDSDADIFVDSISVSNTCGATVCTRIWINGTMFGNIYASPYVTPANTTADPARYPRGMFSYAQDLKSTPQDGVSLASLFVAPYASQTQEFGGKLIIPPNGSCIVFCYARDSSGGQSSASQACEISMQWWEQQIAV